jgi:hypothetical protein
MKLLFAAVIALALTTPAWAGHRESCTTNCNQNTGYCYTSCTGYDW